MAKQVTNAQILSVLENLSTRIDAIEENGPKRRDDDDEMQPLFLRKSAKGSKYSSAVVTLPDGTKCWVNLFENKFHTKGHKDRPTHHLKFGDIVEDDDS